MVNTAYTDPEHTRRQNMIIERAEVIPRVTPKFEVLHRVRFLKEQVLNSNTDGFVLGISGGADSTLAGRLVQLAVDELNNEGHGRTFTFQAVRLPYGVQADMEDVDTAMGFIQPVRDVTVNIKPMVDALTGSYKDAMSSVMTDFTKGNSKARVRMVVQYSIAGDNNLLVVGTDQAAEFTMGFYTKYGDGASDILPLWGLTKDQVFALLEYLECPESLILKAPTADLLDDNPGITDEDALGVSYEVLNAYLKGVPVGDTDAALIEAQFLKTEHKRHMPVGVQVF